MKFLSVTGHKDDMDRVIDQYLSKHEMQYENALSELKTVSNLRPFMATNPYKDVYQQACLLTDSFPKETIDNAREITLDEAVAIVTRCQKQFEELASKSKRKALWARFPISPNWIMISAAFSILNLSNSVLDAFPGNIMTSFITMYMTL